MNGVQIAVIRYLPELINCYSSRGNFPERRGEVKSGVIKQNRWREYPFSFFMLLADKN